jgi:hypothetical protein
VKVPLKITPPNRQENETRYEYKTREIYETLADGTWNVPATLKTKPHIRHRKIHIFRYVIQSNRDKL